MTLAASAVGATLESANFRGSEGITRKTNEARGSEARTPQSAALPDRYRVNTLNIADLCQSDPSLRPFLDLRARQQRHQVEPLCRGIPLGPRSPSTSGSSRNELLQVAP